jgi:hypothetical protein
MCAPGTSPNECVHSYFDSMIQKAPFCMDTFEVGSIGSSFTAVRT